MQKLQDHKKYTIMLSVNSMETISSFCNGTGVDRNVLIRRSIDRLAEELENRAKEKMSVNKMLDNAIGDLPI